MASAVTVDAGKAIEQRAAATAFDSSDLWLLCKAGSHRFAVPIVNVTEIMRMLPVEAVNGAPPIVRGLSVIRGAAVPVIDTGRVLGDETARYERLIAVRTGERAVALAASAVSGVQRIQESQRGELPPVLRDAEAIAALARLDQELTFFLRVARALPDHFHIGNDAGLGVS